MSTAVAKRSNARAVGEMIAVAAHAAGIHLDLTVCVVGGDDETALAHNLCLDGAIDGYISLADRKDGHVEILSYARTSEVDRRLAEVCDAVSAKLVAAYRPAQWKTWSTGHGGAA